MSKSPNPCGELPRIVEIERRFEQLSARADRAASDRAELRAMIYRDRGRDRLGVLLCVAVFALSIALVVWTFATIGGPS